MIIKNKTFSYAEHATRANRLIGGGTMGPAPAPDWLIEHPDAVDDELGILKTGKEAIVSLMERRLDDVRHYYARKTFRDPERRAFRRDSTYRRERSRGGRSSDLLRTQGNRGQALRAAEWRANEFAVLSSLYRAGLQVPYPMELVEEHILMEYVGDAESAAPRLTNNRPSSPEELADLFDQAISGIRTIVHNGYVHADLSPFNLLVWENRLWFIDFPQAATIRQSSEWMSLLERDVANVCAWFTSRGLEVDPGEQLAQLL